MRCHDPLVRYWDELQMPVERDLPPLAGVDAVIFAVPHDCYRTLDLASWLGEARPVILDSFDVLAPEQRSLLERLGCQVASIGRGSRR